LDFIRGVAKFLSTHSPNSHGTPEDVLRYPGWETKCQPTDNLPEFRIIQVYWPNFTALSVGLDILLRYNSDL